jgi:hypothetical protein
VVLSTAHGSDTLAHFGCSDIILDWIIAKISLLTTTESTLQWTVTAANQRRAMASRNSRRGRDAAPLHRGAQCKSQPHGSREGASKFDARSNPVILDNGKRCADARSGGLADIQAAHRSIAAFVWDRRIQSLDSVFQGLAMKPWQVLFAIELLMEHVLGAVLQLSR